MTGAEQGTARPRQTGSTVRPASARRLLTRLLGRGLGRARARTLARPLARTLAPTLALVTLAAVTAPGPSAAHTLSANEVIARIRAADMVKAFDVVSVERNADLDRLLVIRVGSGWQRADPALRREASQKWLHMWRAATRNGVVAVLEADSDTSLVGFDAEGRATLKDPKP